MAALDRFSEVTRRWFTGAFEGPTSAQEQGWDAISQGEHTLVLAPTGSGKTLAAFLWALDRLLGTPLEAVPEEKSRCRVLYISPLKALTYDVERNLRGPLAGIANEASRSGVTLPEIKVSTRTGDTPDVDRRDIARHPPDILITTPESLYLMLTSQVREILASVEVVIIDEIHAVAPTKRGTHLALTMERLEKLVRASGRPSPQRIGLSATQRPLEEVAKFLGGRVRTGDTWKPRPVKIVDTGVRKELQLQIVVPVEDMSQLGKRREPEDEDFVMNGAAAGDPEVRSSIWPSVHPVLLDLITTHRSTLIFVNNRRLSERLAASLNNLARERGILTEGAPDLVRAHHGSIAREQRLDIEDSLKAGRLPGLVCTSSLELGIDMGAVDLVVQVESPYSVASGLQRIGRAGHQVGEPSKGRIFPKFRGDLINATVVSMRMQDGLIEETRVPRNPLDVLSQQIVAMVATEPCSVDEVAEVALGTYSFSELTQDALEGVLDMLSGRYPSDEFAELRPRLTWDRITGELTERKGARMLAVTSGGTIPDRGLYGVFTPEGGRVGELDEEMVYESRVGETFLLGATSWRIEDITKDRVVVTPAPGVPGKMPFWHGDSIGRPLELGKAIGAFHREAVDLTDAELQRRAGLDDLAVRNLRQYLDEEREATGGVLPTDRQLVVERFRDELGDWRVVLLSPLGAKVHAPWALAIEAQLRERLDMEVQAIWGNDGIVLRLPEADEAPAADAFVLDPDQIEEIVTNEVGQSAVFAARFRENAARALLLPRRRPGSRTPLWQQRQRSADLLKVASQYGSFPILLETYRECLRDVFDLPGLVSVLRDVRARRIRVVEVETPQPSPFAASVAFSYVASFMYEGDAPLAERRAQALTLDRRMLAELVGADELRELIDAEALEQLELELQRLDERRWAKTPEDAADVLRRIGDLTEDELLARCTPEVRELGAAGLARHLIETRRVIAVRVAGEGRLIAIEDAGRYRDALGASPPPGVPDAFLQPVDDALTQLVRRWARTHGPFLTPEPAARLGVPEELVDEVLRRLELQGTIAKGAFRPGGVERDWCDSDVLTQLRQRSLAALRKEVEPTGPEALARFLPAWHGVGSEATGVDRLFEVIAQLQGVPIPASVLEKDVLPARVSRYAPRMLDELLASGEVLWLGGGPLGRDDGKVLLFLRATAPLLYPRLLTADRGVPEGKLHQQVRELLQGRGACFFRELAVIADEKAVVDALWDLVWSGEVTNDGFGAVRAFSGTKQRRGQSKPAGRVRPRLGSITATGPATGQGRWTLVSRDLGLDLAAPPATESLHQLAATLLERHGVLTREAVRGEGVPGAFAGVYPVLRALEESGRIRRGYFVSGLGGAQFALPGAVDRLRAFRDGPAEGSPRVLVLAATDPANAYGVAMPWPKIEGTRPQRVAGAFVVLVDGTPALYVEKGAKGLQLLRESDGTWESDAVQGVLRLLDGRLQKLQIERWPDGFELLLAEAGFIPTPKGLVKYA